MIIVRYLPDGRQLLDLVALSLTLKLAPRTLRRKLTAAACDVRSRTNLYDPEAAAVAVADTKPRTLDKRKP